MQPLLYASSGTLCSHASQHEQDPEFVDGHHGPLTAEQKAECVAVQPQCIQRRDDSVRYRKHFDDADKDKDGFLNLQVCICLCEVDTSLKFGAQEFQGLTAESDADAGEDEHIKALFAEVDTSKDGKVILPALLNPLFSCAHYCVVVNLPSWKMSQCMSRSASRNTWATMPPKPPRLKSTLLPLLLKKRRRGQHSFSNLNLKCCSERVCRFRGRVNHGAQPTAVGSSLLHHK